MLKVVLCLRHMKKDSGAEGSIMFEMHVKG